MHFYWKKEYETNIEEIDSQHQHFVKILNDLYDAILKKETEQRLKGIFDDLIDYAGKHFKTEEKYFEEYKYEGAGEHIIEHNKLRDRLAELHKQFDTNKTVLSFTLIDFLIDWLASHLEVMDQKYIKCFQENGK